jgi:hypothetical protein
MGQAEYAGTNNGVRPPKHVNLLLRQGFWPAVFSCSKAEIGILDF